MTFCSSPKNILASALLFLCNFAFSNSEYSYNELEDGVEITGCSGECLVLPEDIDGKRVVGISDYASLIVFDGLGFSGTWSMADGTPSNELQDINTIDIPDSYKHVGKYFFSNFNTKHASFGDSIQTIGMGAFSNNSIKDVVIPDSVLEISSKAFAINPLSHVVFLGNRPNIGDGAFETQYQQLSKELICLLEVRETDKDFNDCYPEINSPNTYFTNCLTAKESSERASMTESDLFPMDYSCSWNTYGDYEITQFELDIRIGWIIRRIAPEIGFNINFSSFFSPGSILNASLCPEELECYANPFFVAGFDIDDYVNLLSENFDTPFYELDIDDLMSVFESGSFTIYDSSLPSVPTMIPEGLPSIYNFFEVSTPVIIPEGYSSLIEYELPPSIYYCSGKTGWPGEPINGVIPEERDCDFVVWDIDQNNLVDALTDGLILMRYAFGLRGDSLTENAISSESNLYKSEIEQNIEQIINLVDVNDDGTFDALTDGLILLRYFFGVSEDKLVDEEMLTSNRPSAGSIKAYIESHMIKALSN